MSFLIIGLDELAKCPNVYCKVSGALGADPHWDQESFTKSVKPCLEAFGMDRYINTFVNYFIANVFLDVVFP